MKLFLIVIALIFSSCILNDDIEQVQSPEITLEEYFTKNYSECTSYESEEQCFERDSAIVNHATDEFQVNLPVSALTVCQFEKESNELIFCECLPGGDSNSIKVNESTGLVLFANYQNCELGEITSFKVE